VVSVLRIERWELASMAAKATEIHDIENAATTTTGARIRYPVLNIVPSDN
jgi:hypothetical protein